MHDRAGRAHDRVGRLNTRATKIFCRDIDFSVVTGLYSGKKKIKKKRPPWDWGVTYISLCEGNICQQ